VSLYDCAASDGRDEVSKCICIVLNAAAKARAKHKSQSSGLRQLIWDLVCEYHERKCIGKLEHALLRDELEEYFRGGRGNGGAAGIGAGLKLDPR